jgi:hypothetical protein
MTWNVLVSTVLYFDVYVPITENNWTPNGCFKMHAICHLIYKYYNCVMSRMRHGFRCRFYTLSLRTLYCSSCRNKFWGH